MRFRRSFPLVLLAISGSTYSQPATEVEPKVALVLGAGAQLGWAHIGVLKWLEEHRVPVHCIAGTSMGALIGGMYATGISPDEMREMATSVDWDTALSGEPPYPYLDFRRKEDRRQVPGVLEFGAKNGIQAPFGVSSAPEFGLLMSRAALPYTEETNFDDLPIPFRAVAFDYMRLRRYVPSGGSLPLAIRASTAIPLVFAPVVSQNRLLGDGGVLESLPVPTAVETFRPSAVIAVNVLPERSRATTDTEPIRHPSGERVPVKVEQLDAVKQAARLLEAMWAQQTEDAKKVLAEYGDNGVLIRPDVLQSTRGWSEFDWFIQKGYEAAESNRNQLSRFQLDEAAWARFTAWRTSRRSARSFDPASTEVIAARTTGGRIADIETRVSSEVGYPGRLDAESFAHPSPAIRQLEDSLRRSMGSGRLLQVTYEAAPDGTLRIFADPKPYLPSLLVASPQLTAGEMLQTRGAVSARWVRFDPIGTGSEFRFDLGVGTRNLGHAELFRPLTRDLFTSFRLGASMEPRDVYADGDRLGTLTVERAFVGVDVGVTVGNKTQLRAGLDLGRARSYTVSGPSDLESYSGPESFASLRLTHDGLDRAMVPTQGALIEGAVRTYFQTPSATGGMRQAEASATAFFPAGPGSLFAFGKGGSSFGDEDASVPFRLGGLMRFSVLSSDEAIASDYVLGGAGYMLQIGKAPLGLGSGVVRLGGWAEYGRLDLLSGVSYQGWSLSGGLFSETPLGPVFLGVSSDAKNRTRLHVTMGRLF